MFFIRRVAWVVVWLGCVASLHALEVQYGSLFRVQGIELKDNRPVLPLSRGQYANVRVLDKETWEFVRTCKSPCTQTATGEIEVFSLRAAKTRPGMWISEVAVDKKWLLTFLVFKEGKKFGFITPQPVTIQDSAWLDKLHRLLQERIESGDK